MEARQVHLSPFQKKIQQLLIERRESLVADLRQATAQMVQEDEVYTDAVDQASADIDRNFHLQMKNRDRDILWQVDEALKRIASGDFGDCERCDEEISEARIQAFPLTTLCIDCKAELESEGHRFLSRA